MYWIIISIIFLVVLTVFTGTMMYLVLKNDSDSVSTSQNILNKFESDNLSATLTEMINFHKKHEDLKKYNIN